MVSSQPEKGLFWFCIILTTIVIIFCTCIGIICCLCDRKKKRKYDVRKAEERQTLIINPEVSVMPRDDDYNLDPFRDEVNYSKKQSLSCESSRRNIRERDMAFRKQQQGDNLTNISCSKERDRTVVPYFQNTAPTSSPKEFDETGIVYNMSSAPITPVPSQISRAISPKVRFASRPAKKQVRSLEAISSEGNVTSSPRL